MGSAIRSIRSHEALETLLQLTFDRSYPNRTIRVTLCASVDLFTFIDTSPSNRLRYASF